MRIWKCFPTFALYVELLSKLQIYSFYFAMLLNCTDSEGREVSSLRLLAHPMLVTLWDGVWDNNLSFTLMLTEHRVNFSFWSCTNFSQGVCSQAQN